EIYTLSLHDALPISLTRRSSQRLRAACESGRRSGPAFIERGQKSDLSVASSYSDAARRRTSPPSSAAIARPSRKSTRLGAIAARSEEHTSELQSRSE